MKNSDRKTENSIVKALKGVCDVLLNDTKGFCWLTHFVDYANVSQSLRIVCVFDTNQALLDAENEGLTRTIPDLAATHLEKEGLGISSIEKAVRFDTEENGADVNKARWCRKYVHK